MYGARTTARALAENPEALDVWITWATAVLYHVRRELGLEIGGCRDRQAGASVDGEAERPPLRLVDLG